MNTFHMHSYNLIYIVINYRDIGFENSCWKPFLTILTDLHASGFTATSGTDFTVDEVSPISLDPNETTVVTITIVDDVVWERDEFFTVSLNGSGVGNGVISTYVEILDDDRK